MDSTTSNSDSNCEHAALNLKPDAVPGSGKTFEYYFTRFLVVIAGVIVGAVLAEFIGLITRLVPLFC